MRLDEALAVTPEDGGGAGAALATAETIYTAHMDDEGHLVLTYQPVDKSVPESFRLVALEETDAYALARAVMRASGGALTGNEVGWEPVPASPADVAGDAAKKGRAAPRGVAATVVDGSSVSRTASDATGRQNAETSQ